MIKGEWNHTITAIRLISNRTPRHRVIPVSPETIFHVLWSIKVRSLSPIKLICCETVEWIINEPKQLLHRQQDNVLKIYSRHRLFYFCVTTMHWSIFPGGCKTPIIYRTPLFYSGCLTDSIKRIPSELRAKCWYCCSSFLYRGGSGRRDQSVGRFQAKEEQEVAVYFSHFLFEAPLVSLLLPLPLL